LGPKPAHGRHPNGCVAGTPHRRREARTELQRSSSPERSPSAVVPRFARRRRSESTAIPSLRSPLHGSSLPRAVPPSDPPHSFPAAAFIRLCSVV
ncbi:hypothetical protein U9M48_026288, partial [Paspalum notatum var. saurae]